MKLSAFVNGKVLTDRGIESGRAVLVEGARIVEVVDDNDARVAQADCCDINGNILLPGFIDTQVNGGGGVLFNADPTLEGIRRIAQAHCRFGTTGLLPTLITDDADTMSRALAAVDAAIEAAIPGILGIHLEGPFLSPERPGIHDRSKIRQLAAGDLASLCPSRRGLTLLTVAPEQISAEIIQELRARGFILMAGHTAGSYEQIRAGLDAGLRGFTHLFNAMTPLQGREPGAVGAALEDDDCWCGVIVDGHHVHPASLRVALRAKAPRKFMLVTDAMPPVGTTMNSFLLGSETIVCEDGACRAANGTLAGSCLDMATAVRNTATLLGLPLAEAARMASAYPAEFLGIQHERGRIASGCRADFVLMDERLNVRETWIDGIRRWSDSSA